MSSENITNLDDEVSLKNKKAYFMHTIEQEGNTFKTIYFSIRS